ncbi:MAG: hypothetical protein JSS81_15495 [Acidobacteria bacterium]|nr:hypothetical protein [Acidobacteriota bacterium]
MFERAIVALRSLPPETRFKKLTAAEILEQLERSMASRRRLEDLDNELALESVVRENEDERSLDVLEEFVDGVIGHADYGRDSALYESLGFVRKSKRKSGLTRRRKEKGGTPMP